MILFNILLLFLFKISWYWEGYWDSYWDRCNIGRGNNVNKKESKRREKITCYAEKLILDVAKRSVGKSIPFSMHKVKKPENFAELVKKVEQEEGQLPSRSNGLSLRPLTSIGIVTYSGVES